MKPGSLVQEDKGVALDWESGLYLCGGRFLKTFCAQFLMRHDSTNILYAILAPKRFGLSIVCFRYNAARSRYEAGLTLRVTDSPLLFSAEWVTLGGEYKGVRALKILDAPWRRDGYQAEKLARARVPVS